MTEYDHLETDEAISEHDKRIRAEVLAACIRGAKVYFDDFRDVPPPPITIEEVIRFLRGVQPAATDLEALLREARLKEAKWWVNNHYPSPQNHAPVKCQCFVCNHVAELEKARAILEKT